MSDKPLESFKSSARDSKRRNFNEIRTDGQCGANRPLSSNSELGDLHRQTCQLCDHPYHSIVITKRRTVHFRVAPIYTCQVPPLHKANATISQRLGRRKRLADILAVSSLHHPLQSVSFKPTAPLRCSLFISKVYMQTEHQILVIKVSQ